MIEVQRCLVMQRENEERRFALSAESGRWQQAPSRAAAAVAAPQSLVERPNPQTARERIAILALLNSASSQDSQVMFHERLASVRAPQAQRDTARRHVLNRLEQHSHTASDGSVHDASPSDSETSDERVLERGLRESDAVDTDQLARTNSSLGQHGRRRWTPEEDALLQRIVGVSGARNWNRIASQLDGRTGQQARLRFKNYLRSCQELSNKGLFTPEQDRLILSVDPGDPNKWKRVAVQLGRSNHAVKNRYHLLKRRIRRAEQQRAASSGSNKEAEPVTNDPMVRSIEPRRPTTD
mmetsp:Transcript_12250/g.33028  ORF Transcript_12250/g.33028 Transcript_12250/m.33028 type:complete len:296 (-) Transcript_12250:72-959(-)